MFTVGPYLVRYSWPTETPGLLVFSETARPRIRPPSCFFIGGSDYHPPRVFHLPVSPAVPDALAAHHLRWKRSIKRLHPDQTESGRIAVALWLACGEYSYLSGLSWTGQTSLSLRHTVEPSSETHSILLAVFLSIEKFFQSCWEGERRGVCIFTVEVGKDSLTAACSYTSGALLCLLALEYPVDKHKRPLDGKETRLNMDERRSNSMRLTYEFKMTLPAVVFSVLLDFIFFPLKKKRKASYENMF